MRPILLGLTLVDWAAVAGLAVVVPLGLRRPAAPWVGVALLLVVSFRCDRGTAPAVALVLPWLGLAVASGLVALRRAGPPRRWTMADLAALAAHGYVGVAAGAMVMSRAGLQPLGQYEPIVELTGVHFTYVGAGAVPLAGAALAAARGPRARRLGLLAVAVTVGAPAVVAVGFLTGWALAQVGGAVLMTLGVWATGALELVRAAGRRTPWGQRALLATSGLAVWVPMVLAVAWAAGQHWDVPALSIPDMARTHGVVNALGFIGAGLLAVRHDRIDRPPGARVPHAAAAS